MVGIVTWAARLAGMLSVRSGHPPASSGMVLELSLENTDRWAKGCLVFSFNLMETHFFLLFTYLVPSLHGK